MADDIVDGYPIQLPRYRRKRGDACVIELATVTEGGAKVDLSGYGTAWTAQLRPSPQSATVIDFAIDDTLVGDADDPHLTISLTGVQTAGLVQSTYVYDVQATGGGESPFTVWSGSLVMVGDVDRV